MRVGIIGLLHESNTFSPIRTELKQFEELNLLEGDSVRDAFENSQHEIGGFFAGLDAAATELGQAFAPVPLFAARALPSGIITGECWQNLMNRMFDQLAQASSLDGILVAPHGATVSEEFPDADGEWLSRLRQFLPAHCPIIGTVDLHANLSRKMVDSCDALIAYRTNPHLDQRLRGIDAARIMTKTLVGQLSPTMDACFLPMTINIERQMTEEPHWSEMNALADHQLSDLRMISNSIVHGFPYADVTEMGTATIAITNGDADLARASAQELASTLWKSRDQFLPTLIEIDDALDVAIAAKGPVCLLDMGDNVGGGSPADSTWLAHAIHKRCLGDSFVCLFDPEAVQAASKAGQGMTVELRIGGHSGALHGPPFEDRFDVIRICDGHFSESQVRHGGFAEFDQGLTAIVKSSSGLVVMITSKRMVPFSLQQLRSCGLAPEDFRYLVAKGVNAPVAAYREVCDTLIRVNTRGCTTADLGQLDYDHRRVPLFPFEADTHWDNDA